MVAMATAVDRG